MGFPISGGRWRDKFDQRNCFLGQKYYREFIYRTFTGEGGINHKPMGFEYMK